MWRLYGDEKSITVIEVEIRNWENLTMQKKSDISFYEHYANTESRQHRIVQKEFCVLLITFKNYFLIALWITSR